MTNENAINVLRYLYLSPPRTSKAAFDAFRHAIEMAIEALKEPQPEPQWIPVTKEEMFKAGYDGREIIFKVDGRLFAIRELAQ